MLMTHLLIQQHRDMQISQTMQGACKQRVFHGTVASNSDYACIYVWIIGTDLCILLSDDLPCIFRIRSLT